MEIRDIHCQCGCGKVLGTVEFPEGVSEQQWERALDGYLAEGCTLSAPEER